MDYMDEISMFCDDCGEPIYIDDPYYRIGTSVYCESCIDSCRHTAKTSINERVCVCEEF